MESTPNEVWFSRLKEYDSLNRMKGSALKASAEQTERLTKLEMRKSAACAEAAALQSEHTQIQQRYFEAEKKLNSAEEQATRLREIGGADEKISKFMADASAAENLLFELLERTESIQGELADKKTFLSGLEKTIFETQQDVDEELQGQRVQIDQAELRLKLIEEELPLDFRGLLERTLKKKLAIGPFTRIEHGSCFFCRHKLSRQDESEIDVQKLLKVCAQCSRIFLPYGT